MSPVLFYAFTLVIIFFVYSILIMGLNIQFGQAGILNFAYIAFVAVGAYFTGVLSLGPPPPGSGESYILGTTLPFPLNLLLGAIAASILAVFIGLIAFRRLRSDYLAIVMISVSIVLYDIVSTNTALFDGADGLNGVPQPFGLDPNTFLYAFSAFAGVVMLLMWWISRQISAAPLGRTFRAIRDDPDVARALGKNVFRYQMLALVIGAFYAGLGGGLLMEFIGAFNTSGWTSGETFVIFAALIIGGRGSNLGSLAGALIVPVIFVELSRYLPQIASRPDLVPDIRNVLIGVLLIGTLWFRPQGLIPEPRRRFKRLLRGMARSRLGGGGPTQAGAAKGD
ncbi:MAG: branched-chain amino acid ABC transporter permease [Chloroflexota bacterium]|nr:branched-chain amino acid ABC transporter permease [Chloroflexota bacterium]